MRRTAIQKWPNSCLWRGNLHKSFRKAKITIPVLRGIDFTARRGQFTAVVGQSGSGKSTLLHVLATLDAPDAGEVHFEGQRIDNLAAVKRDRIRNRSLGMIFQFYHLLPELTTLENVLMPIMISQGIWRYWRSKRTYSRAGRKIAGHGRPFASLASPAAGAVREAKCSVPRLPVR